MQYLGVNRFADAERSADSEEKNAFCAKLQRLGGKRCENLEECEDFNC